MFPALLVGALMIVAGGVSAPRQAAPTTHRDLELKTRGGEPLLVLDPDCEDCTGDRLDLFAFASADSAIFIFSGVRNELLKYALMPTRAKLVEVIPGFPIVAASSVPVDGCQSPQGTILLLSDIGSLRDRYRLSVYDRAASKWRRPVLFDLAAARSAQLNGRSFPIFARLLVDADREGRALVYDTDSWSPRLWEVPLAGADDGAPKRAIARPITVSEAGATLGPVGQLKRLETEDRTSPAHGRRPPRIVRILADGSELRIDIERGYSRSLSHLSRDGVVLARNAIESQPGALLPGGKGDFVALADGRIVQLLVAGDVLRLRVWPHDLR